MIFRKSWFLNNFESLTRLFVVGNAPKDINMARAMEQFASDLMPEGSKSYLSPVTPDN